VFVSLLPTSAGVLLLLHAPCVPSANRQPMQHVLCNCTVPAVSSSGAASLSTLHRPCVVRSCFYLLRPCRPCTRWQRRHVGQLQTKQCYPWSSRAGARATDNAHYLPPSALQISGIAQLDAICMHLVSPCIQNLLMACPVLVAA
jgi:hypothetical protein